MSELMGRRIAAVAGLLGAICLFTGNGYLIGETSTEDSAATLLKSVQNLDAMNAGVAFIVAAAALLLLFSTTLRAVLAEAEPEPGRMAQLSLAGAVAGSATLIVGPIIMHSVAWRASIEPSSVDGGIAAIAHATVATGFFFATIFFGLAALATAAVTLRTGVLPKWFGWFALVMSICMLVGSVGSVYDAALGFLAGLPMILFYMVASVVVFLRLRRAT